MLLDEQLIVRGCAALRDYCWRSKCEAEAREWHARMTERAALLQSAEEERGALHLAHKLEPHGLPEAAIESLHARSQTVPGLRKAYVVRKRVKHFPEQPCYVLGFTVRGILNGKRRRAAVQAQVTAAVRFHGETLIISVEGDNYRCGRKLMWMRGARVL